MSNTVRKAGTGGVSFFGVLTIVFVTLKLCGLIGWSWLWVLAPIWMPMAFAVLLVIVALALR